MKGTAPPDARADSNGGMTLQDTLDLDALHTEHEPEPPPGVPPAVLRIAIPFGPTQVPTEIPVVAGNIHPEQHCEGLSCPLHDRPSPHLLADQPMRLRYEFTDRGTRNLPVVVERLCPRVPGRYHTDPDSLLHAFGVLDPARYALLRAGDESDCGCAASIELDLTLQDLPVPPAACALVLVTTLNSQYTADLVHGRVRRDLGINPPTECFTPNGTWQPVTLISQPRRGESWIVHHASGMNCVSSVVVDVEVLTGPHVS